MKINGVEFEFDASDSNCLRQMENSLTAMSIEQSQITEKYNIGELKSFEFISGYCDIIKRFFINATDKDIVKDTTSLDKVIGFYNEFLNQIESAGKHTQQLISKYDPKKVR